MTDMYNWRIELESRVAGIARQILETVPLASHLVDDSALVETYYLRHRIETIKRIELTSRIDALALADMIPLNYGAACKWARYASEEMTHDRLYRRDLARHGLTRKAIDAVAPLPSTFQLIALLESALGSIGPSAAVTYSIFVEWNSAKGSALAAQKAARAFSEAHVVGSTMHCSIDETEDHYAMMLEVLSDLSPRPELVFDLMAQIGSCFAEYFSELAYAEGWRRSQQRATQFSELAV